MTWPFTLDIDTHGHTPLFVQIADGLVDAIYRGRLRPNEIIPGSRQLAQTLGVHRNTVLAAYNELVCQGYLRTEPGRGTFVSGEIPKHRPRAAPTQREIMPSATSYPMTSPPLPPLPPKNSHGLLALGRGIPDLRLVPSDLISRAVRHALKTAGHPLLDYGDIQGHIRLRSALSTMLNHTRGLATRPENILITNGSQMALNLVAQTLIRPGDRVVIEAYGYAPARNTFSAAGAELIPIDVDAHGLNIDALEEVLRDTDIRLIYITPHHQYPTTAVLSTSRRQRLLTLGKRYSFAIVEDDYDNELHYQGRPVLPLASSDTEGGVIYLGSLSKILAPGLRMGYLVAPKTLLAYLLPLRQNVDGGGNPLIEYAVAQLIEDDELQRHTRRIRRILKNRRDYLLDLISTHLGDILSTRRPAGGMATWSAVTPDIDPEAWAARARNKGVFVSPGQWFRADNQPAPFMRLGFAALNEQEMEKSIIALKTAL